MDGIECVRPDGAARRGSRDFVHAVQPDHFFNQVGFPFEVHPERRNTESDGFRCGLSGIDGPGFSSRDLEFELAEIGLDLLGA